MKFKVLPLIIICTTFLAGCGKKQQTSSVPDSTPTSQTSAISYLTFLEKGKMRIDLFDVDVQFSYGGTALSEAVNLLDIHNTSYLSVAANSSEDKKFNFIFFAEAESGHSFKGFTSDGDDLTTVLELNSVKSFFDKFDSERGYIAISTGTTPQWTKGLNEKMDTYIQTNFH